MKKKLQLQQKVMLKKKILVIINLGVKALVNIQGLKFLLTNQLSCKFTLSHYNIIDDIYSFPKVV